MGYTSVNFAIVNAQPKMHCISITVEITNDENTVLTKQKLYFVSEYLEHCRLQDGMWFCLICDSTSKYHGHMRQHIETKHISVTYSCTMCEKTLPTKNALYKHYTRKHNVCYRDLFHDPLN